MSKRVLKSVSRWIMGTLMAFAGVMHFVQPQFYVRIMPDYLPWHLTLVYLSGAFEIGLGLLLLYPRTTRVAAWGIIALLIAVFPANVHVYQNQHLVGGPSVLHLLRLPLQGFLIAWAYWHTRGESQKDSQTDDRVDRRFAE